MTLIYKIALTPPGPASELAAIKLCMASVQVYFNTHIFLHRKR